MRRSTQQSFNYNHAAHRFGDCKESASVDRQSLAHRTYKKCYFQEINNVINEIIFLTQHLFESRSARRRDHF